MMKGEGMPQTECETLIHDCRQWVEWLNWLKKHDMYYENEFHQLPKSTRDKMFDVWKACQKEKQL